MFGFKMTRRVSLQMISLLLSLTVHAASSAAKNSSDAAGMRTHRKCLSPEKVDNRSVKHLKQWRNLDTQSVSSGTRTCGETATQMYLSDRALSPWKYSINKNDNRIPNAITFAECLCEGCIINRQESMSYNSVPVNISRVVHIRIRCPSNPEQYVIKREVIKVPVACVCVVPK